MLWKIDQSQAEFRFSHWQGSINLARPEQGLQIIAPDGAELNGLLAVSFLPPSQPLQQDCFVRQSDLILSYPPREARKFHVQLDYRLLESTSESLLIESWISVQTYLLDNHPAVSVQCPFHPEGIVCFLDNGSQQLLAIDREHLHRSHRSPASFGLGKLAAISGPSVSEQLYVAWMNHPRDQFDTEWSVAEEKETGQIQATLFGHFMEKGVIRRARMRCLISSQAIRQAHLQEVYQAFISSPLPLTA